MGKYLHTIQTRGNGTFIKEGQTKKGLILKIYEVLQHEGNNDNMDVKEKWELQANITISDEDLEETFKAGDKLTNSPLWREFD